MPCIAYDQLYFCQSAVLSLLNSCRVYITLLAKDLLNSSIMCITDCFVDVSSSICNCLKPLWQLTVITYSEKLHISSTMYDNYHF